MAISGDCSLLSVGGSAKQPSICCRSRGHKHHNIAPQCGLILNLLVAAGNQPGPSLGLELLLPPICCSAEIWCLTGRIRNVFGKCSSAGCQALV